jgi:hypothetical protein
VYNGNVINKLHYHAIRIPKNLLRTRQRPNPSRKTNQIIYSAFPQEIIQLAHIDQ